MRELVARTGLLSPPYGDGTFEGSDGTKTVTFSPPYGDGTAIIGFLYDCILFSPPYGDGTARQNILIGTETFSPPYGDGTDTRYQFKWNSEVFAPLRGEPSQSRFTPCQLPRKGELSTG